MDKLMDWLGRWCNLEEAKAEHVAVEQNLVTKGASNDGNQKEVNKVKTADKSPGAGKNGPRPWEYEAEKTIFNDNILKDISKESYYERPTKKLSVSRPKHPKAICSYHDERDRCTTSCKQFKAYLEKLVAERRLDKWVDRGKTLEKAQLNNNN